MNNKLFLLDKRYKITPEEVAEMNSLRKQGTSLKELSEYFKISMTTVIYWTNEKAREKQRIKNAKRRKTGLALKISREKDRNKRRQLWEVVPQTRWLNRFNTAKSAKRTSKKNKLSGISFPIVERHIDKFKVPNSKITITN